MQNFPRSTVSRGQSAIRTTRFGRASAAVEGAAAAGASPGANASYEATPVVAAAAALTARTARLVSFMPDSIGVRGLGAPRGNLKAASRIAAGHDLLLTHGRGRPTVAAHTIDLVPFGGGAR